LAIAVDNLANAHELTKDEEEEAAAEEEVISSFKKIKNSFRINFRNVNGNQKMLNQCLK
jgi:hypothetical protein